MGKYPAMTLWAVYLENFDRDEGREVLKEMDFNWRWGRNPVHCAIY